MASRTLRYFIGGENRDLDRAGRSPHLFFVSEPTDSDFLFRAAPAGAKKLLADSEKLRRAKERARARAEWWDSNSSQPVPKEPTK